MTTILSNLDLSNVLTTKVLAITAVGLLFSNLFKLEEEIIVIPEIDIQSPPHTPVDPFSDLVIQTHSLENAHLAPINSALISPDTLINTPVTPMTPLSPNIYDVLDDFCSQAILDFVANFNINHQAELHDWYLNNGYITTSRNVSVQTNSLLVDSSAQATSNLNDRGSKYYF